MAIPQQTIEQILDRIDIVDLIGQRVKLKKSGRTFSGCCPFHQEKTPSFHVYRDKGYYHCFGCQANGNAIKFLMTLDGRSFPDVIQDLAQQAGIELPKNDAPAAKITYNRTPTTPTQQTAPASTTSQPTAVPTNPQHTDTPTAEQIAPHIDEQPSAQEGNLYDLLEKITQFYQQQLTQSLAAQQYFQKRALQAQTVQDWRLGYAPAEWQHLEKYFPQDIEGLKLLGLIRVNDQGKSFNLLRDRVIFPIRDNKGRVVGFGGRALNDDIKPKYINSPDSVIFHKNQLLFGMYEGRRQRAEQWLMVEGYMDVIALHQAGIPGAVATLGTASNAEHLNMLFRLNRQLTLAFDGDEAGQKAAWRTLNIALPLLTDGRELRFFILPDEHDPDSLIRQIGLQSFKQLLNQAPLLSDYIYQRLSQQEDISHPEGKSNVLNALKQLTDLMPNGSYKYLLTQSFRERLQIWRHKNSITPTDNDQQVNFTRINHIHFMIGLLMHYPILFPHFEILRAYIQPDSLEGQFLELLNKIYEQLPDDIELSRSFILGASCALHPQILPILQHFNINNLYINHPEDMDQHAENLFIHLKIHYLDQLIRKQIELSAVKNINEQLFEAHSKLHQIHFVQ